MFEASSVDNLDPKIHIPDSFQAYNPMLAHQLRQKHPEIRLERAAFGNLMPLLLTGKAPHVVMMFLLNGENYSAALEDISDAAAFTADNGITRPNVERLGIFGTFIDTRQDKPSLVPIPEKENEFAIVTSQSSWTKEVLAPMLALSGAEYLVQIDGHSRSASKHIKSAGVETVDLTAANLMLDDLEERGFLKNDLANVFCGVDSGNLPLVKTVLKKRDFEVAVIDKLRIPMGRGEKSRTERKLASGNVRGKRVILIDDMASSGETLLDTAIMLLKKEGAKELVICATHAVFSGREYYKYLRSLVEIKEVKIVMTTNTIPLERPRPGSHKSLPWGYEKNTEVKKQVEMININEQIGLIFQALMASGSLSEIRNSLSHLTLVEDKISDIYKELTGNELPKKIVTHEYLEGGKMVPLEKPFEL